MLENADHFRARAINSKLKIGHSRPGLFGSVHENTNTYHIPRSGSRSTGRQF